MTDTKTILKNLKKIPIEFGYYRAELLYDENYEMYVRESDIKEKIGITIGDYEHWIRKRKDEFEKEREFKLNKNFFDSYYINENGKAVKIRNMMGITYYYIDNMSKIDSFLIMIYWNIRNCRTIYIKS